MLVWVVVCRAKASPMALVLSGRSDWGKKLHGVQSMQHLVWKGLHRGPATLSRGGGGCDSVICSKPLGG